MYKIAFIGNSESPAKLLELFKRQTPGRLGIWGQLQGVDNYEEADYYGVIDYLPSGLNVDAKKCVFLGAHPETMSAYRNMDNYECLAKFDARKTFGFGEWWINFDYDYLKALKPPVKTSSLAAVVSNARSQPYHTARIEWLKRFTNNKDLDFHLYGRIEPDTFEMARYYRGACGSLDARGFAISGNDHMSGKELVYLEHEFAIEFDATGEYYFSERIFDCLLLWSMPLYWGGKRLHEFIPAESFRYIDIDKSGEDVLKYVEEQIYFKSLPAIEKAREILLDELQLWARIHFSIFGSYK